MVDLETKKKDKRDLTLARMPLHVAQSTTKSGLEVAQSEVLEKVERSEFGRVRLFQLEQVIEDGCQSLEFPVHWDVMQSQSRTVLPCQMGELLI